MKVLCDVCAAEAASVFCCADEAALCDACDRRVHRANKLAGKHRRFSLLHPSPSSQPAAAPPPPLCDICQEKRGFLFCKEDRAILCRECDVPVHTASELTMRHSRYLLTGVRLSSEPAASPAPPSEEENSSSFCCSGDDAAPPAPATSSHGGSSGSGSSSSISEYLTKTLPGWHVEDFLIDDASGATAATATTSAGVFTDGSYQGVARTGGAQEARYPAWMAPEQLFFDGGGGAAGDALASRERWVPQMMHSELAGSKRSRTTTTLTSYSYW